ncbi:MAG TPA: hotdog domain-containing protein, partial [Candidatus Baltobacteraceae bacterium]|nr:hotdog domain-containing protein [Candidatus Baltobacteraceae bacterium]
MDIAGGMMADEIAGGRTVTVAVEKMVFKLPVRAGETVSIHGTLLQIGNSSMDISIEVWAKPLSGEFRAERHLVTEGIFRYVAIDDRGRPRSVPDNWRCFSGSNDIS